MARGMHEDLVQQSGFISQFAEATTMTYLTHEGWLGNCTLGRPQPQAHFTSCRAASKRIPHPILRALDRDSAPIDVLIVEDDAITRMTLRHLLEEQGYTCAEADDGCEAVEIARQCPPRLVLLDVMMPGLDGFSVARQLRSDPRTRGARIHFLTGRDDPDARRAARREGGAGLLTKPIDFEGLLDTVSVAMTCGGMMPQVAVG
jgi:CheY-like chemotaxis protein